jgi:hypothetical protein
MKYETQIIPGDGETVEIETDDPEVVSELEAFDGAGGNGASGRARFRVPRSEALLRFPHHFGDAA